MGVGVQDAWRCGEAGKHETQVHLRAAMWGEDLRCRSEPRDNVGGNPRRRHWTSGAAVQLDHLNIQPTVNLKSGLSTSPRRISPKNAPPRVGVCMPPKMPMPTSMSSS